MTSTPQEEAIKKRTPAELRNEQQRKLQEARAARRLKISPQEAGERRAVSIRRFKRFELISVIILAIVIAVLSFFVFEAAKTGAENEAVLNVTLLIWGAIALQSAIVIRTSFVRMSADDLLSEDKTDHPFRGWRFTYFTPVIATAILLPAIFAGIYNFDDGNMILGLFMMLAMSFVVLLLGALVAAFVIAPFEMLARGLIALVRGDRTRTGYIYFGLIGLALLSIIVLGTVAIDPNAPYPRGSVQIILALLGLPGSYRVESEVLLWVVRAVIIAVTAALIWANYSGKRRS